MSSDLSAYLAFGLAHTPEEFKAFDEDDDIINPIQEDPEVELLSGGVYENYHYVVTTPKLSFSDWEGLPQVLPIPTSEEIALIKETGAKLGMCGEPVWMIVAGYQ
jgi:hypothetical protein